jgi:hypothetical protein
MATPLQELAESFQDQMGPCWLSGALVTMVRGALSLWMEETVRYQSVRGCSCEYIQ